MTKKDFIWLVIRSLGIFKLMLSLRLIATTILSLAAALMLCPTSDISDKITLTIFLRLIADGVFGILVIGYLLFFGKIIFSIVHRTSSMTLDMVLQKQDYLEIAIRFIGIWWLWRIACQIYGLAGGLLSGFLFSHLEWLGNISDTSNLKTMNEMFKKYIHPIQQHMIWYALFDILIYSLLAWYFLKNGGFFINLLNRLWLGKSKEESIHDAVNPAG